MSHLYSPGEPIPQSGIYRVLHDPFHAENHEVICIYGRFFPPCNECAGVKFTLVRGATYILNHACFRQHSITTL
jgi:hypothetical protein